ncbi:E3 ubiquitin-protein ligase RNF34-like [Clinocottus analis]|uniref:E3 ubiquitin-protein ligase RNF34-like n=1 Tax=Clinocottus analis TaxID=304258 RepID=UPI0035C1782C
MVLPEVETNQSRASTPSSDVRHDYENVPEKKDDRDYLNVETMHLTAASTADVSAQSDSEDEDDDSDDDDDDEDDDEGNYVNVLDGAQTDVPQ